MTAIRTISTLIMSVAFGFFGVAKIAQAALVTEQDSWARLSEGQWATIGALEIAAAISLLLALMPQFRMLGIAAATGLVALTICAIIFHVSNSDAASAWIPAAIQGTIASSYVALGRRDVRQPSPAAMAVAK